MFASSTFFCNTAELFLEFIPNANGSRGVVVVLREEDLTVVARWASWQEGGQQGSMARLRQQRGRLGYECTRERGIDVGA